MENWVAYTVSATNFEKDYKTTDIWMTSWDGMKTISLTHSTESDESTPRWSPDNKFLGFLSERKSKEDDEEESQLWLMNREGGEAEKITGFPAGVEDYAWSPDGKRIAIIANVKDTTKYIEGTETPIPIVIDRYYFKEDYSGYLGKERKHLYVMDMASRDTFRVVDGNYEEELPSWSPDGKSIAFVSKRAREDWDRDNNFDIYVVDAKPHAVPRQLTKSPGADADPSYESYPSWSPDGKYIAYFQGGPLKLIYYGTQRLAVVPVDGGDPKILTANYDRNTWGAQFSSDGKDIYFISEDDQKPQS
jgi:Tol biopolymer transport system component